MSKPRRFQLKACYPPYSEVPSKVILPGGIEISIDDYVYIHGNIHDSRYTIGRVVEFIGSDYSIPRTRSLTNKRATQEPIPSSTSEKKQKSFYSPSPLENEALPNSYINTNSPNIKPGLDSSVQLSKVASEDYKDNHLLTAPTNDDSLNKKRLRSESTTGSAMKCDNISDFMVKPVVKTVFSDDIQLKIACFIRQIDLDDRKTHNLDHKRLVAIMKTEVHSLTLFRGKCTVQHSSQIKNLNSFKRLQDHFYYNTLYDTFIPRLYDVIPVSSVLNVPRQVKQKLLDTYKFIFCEQDKTNDLTQKTRICVICSEWCPSDESINCSECRSPIHWKCLSPPLTRDPPKGYALQCAPCIKLIDENRSKKKFEMVDRKARIRKSASLNPDPHNPTSSSSSSTHGSSSITPNLVTNEKSFLSESNHSNSSKEGSPSQKESLPFKKRKISENYNKLIWPFRYLGVFCNIESVLFDDVNIGPVSGSRVGKNYQAYVPDFDNAKPKPKPNRSRRVRRFTKNKSKKKNTLSKTPSHESDDDEYEISRFVSSYLTVYEQPNASEENSDTQFDDYMERASLIFKNHMAKYIDFGSDNAMYAALQTLTVNSRNYTVALEEASKYPEKYMQITFGRIHKPGYSSIKNIPEPNINQEKQVSGLGYSSLRSTVKDSVDDGTLVDKSILSDERKSQPSSFSKPKSQLIWNKDDDIAEDGGIFPLLAQQTSTKFYGPFDPIYDENKSYLEQFYEWTDADIKKLEELFYTYGHDFIPIYKALPHIPRKAVLLRYFKLYSEDKYVDPRSRSKKSRNSSKPSSSPAADLSFQHQDLSESMNIRLRDHSALNTKRAAQLHCASCQCDKSTKWSYIDSNFVVFLESSLHGKKKNNTGTGENEDIYPVYSRSPPVHSPITDLGLQPNVSQPNVIVKKEESRSFPTTLPENCAICLGGFTDLDPKHLSKENVTSPNLNLRCVRCHLAVHSHCYGSYYLTDLKDAKGWECDYCSNLNNPTAKINKVCVLCNRRSIADLPLFKNHEFNNHLLALYSFFTNPSKEQEALSTEEFAAKKENLETVLDTFYRCSKEGNGDSGSKGPYKYYFRDFISEKLPTLNLAKAISKEMCINSEAFWRTGNNNWVHCICALQTPKLKILYKEINPNKPSPRTRTKCSLMASAQANSSQTLVNDTPQHLAYQKVKQVVVEGIESLPKENWKTKCHICREICGAVSDCILDIKEQRIMNTEPKTKSEQDFDFVDSGLAELMEPKVTKLENRDGPGYLDSESKKLNGYVDYLTIPSDQAQLGQDLFRSVKITSEVDIFGQVGNKTSSFLGVGVHPYCAFFSSRVNSMLLKQSSPVYSYLLQALSKDFDKSFTDSQDSKEGHLFTKLQNGYKIEKGVDLVTQTAALDSLDKLLSTSLNNPISSENFSIPSIAVGPYMNKTLSSNSFVQMLMILKNAPHIAQHLLSLVQSSNIGLKNFDGFSDVTLSLNQLIRSLHKSSDYSAKAKEFVDKLDDKSKRISVNQLVGTFICLCTDSKNIDFMNFSQQGALDYPVFALTLLSKIVQEQSKKKSSFVPKFDVKSCIVKESSAVSNLYNYFLRRKTSIPFPNPSKVCGICQIQDSPFWFPLLRSYDKTQKESNYSFNKILINQSTPSFDKSNYNGENNTLENYTEKNSANEPVEWICYHCADS
ncbi:hypothetical protein BB560_002978 [Smittium megazygosporum]|uniref:ELM2 domain-containing protein n=1 Tax=Smittium megazygosporum TaxID=133381 RepID=A0A2T9ZD87_9FUNG|nr:hypothetical protein BB560_002978 [Smittium megazygosporum]